MRKPGELQKPVKAGKLRKDDGFGSCALCGKPATVLISTPGQMGRDIPLCDGHPDTLNDLRLQRT